MSSLIIPLAFCIIISILIWFVIGSKGNWLIKAITTIFCLYFTIAIWYSLFTYLGWPTKDSLPPKYLIHWAQIEEPNPHFDGAIYIWAIELESNNKYQDFLYFLKYYNRKNEPRIYQISYNKNLHKEVQQMMEEIKKGSVYIGGEKSNNNKKLENNLEGKGQFSFSHKSKDQYLYPLPPAKIPEKIQNDN